MWRCGGSRGRPCHSTQLVLQLERIFYPLPSDQEPPMPHPDVPTFSADDAQDDALTADLFAALDESADDEGEPGAPDAAEAPLPEAALREPYALPLALRLAVEPRSYQRAAVDAWLRADGRGLVVLPTGAGKTIVAFHAIAPLGVRTPGVGPTFELLRQC